MGFDYDKARSEVASRHGIPLWFNAWTLRFARCPPGDLVERVHKKERGQARFILF